MFPGLLPSRRRSCLAPWTGSLLRVGLPGCGLSSDENFIDYDLCSQAQLRLDLLPEPMEVFALDGCLLARVTHRTTPVSLLLSGNHQELIRFFVIPSPTSPVVLGLP